VKAFTVQLKEKGIVNFLREYLASGEGDELASLRKLLLGFGVVPVSSAALSNGSTTAMTTTWTAAPALRKSVNDACAAVTSASVAYISTDLQPASLRDPATPNLALLPFTKLALLRILRRREKLPQYNSLSDAIDLLRNAKNIIILSGAGISTSCGIPDFRSANGLYANLQREGKWELDDPQQMFDIRYFVEHPEVF